MTPADARTLVAGGNLELDIGPRSWRTNWPVHLAVAATAVLSVAISPSVPAAILAAAWLLAYLIGHWACVMRRLPGASTASVTATGMLALGLTAVSDQGLHLFATYPLIWVLLPTFRRGLIATILFAAAMVAILILEEDQRTIATVLVPIAVGTGITVFSTFMSMWIWRIEMLSHQRRELAEELRSTVSALEATRAELSAVERRRGADEEAARIAAEIHDTLAQSFTSITMLTQAARQPGSAPSSLLDQIEEVSRGGLAEARGLIARSQSPLDLAASLHRLAEDLEARTGVHAVIDTAEWAPVSTRTGVVLLRTFQEALRNIERHAGESRVCIRLSLRGSTALLEVVDDGAGFDPDLPTAGFGLLGMRARLEAEGGNLTVDSGRGRGTALRAELPRTPDSIDPLDDESHHAH